MSGMGNVYIQVQDSTGNWRTYTVTSNNDLLIMNSINSLKDQFKEHRVRAIDEKGMLIYIV
jgi:hypothetical protein